MPTYPPPQENISLSDAQTSVAPASGRPARLLSLDLLRGLTLGFMILVNNNGSDEGAFWALKHAAWNGFTPTDLVFPTFLFLVGITTVYSTASRLNAGDSRQSIFLHTLRRAAILFCLGLVVNSFPFFHLSTLRVYGVLQRIAVCYLVVAGFYLLDRGWRSKAIALVGLLAGYWFLLRFVPVPGYGLPGHAVPLLDHDGNLTAWLDRQIFSPQHLYERTRDPEGLLSDLPAIGTALIGMLTGLWLRTSRTVAEKARGCVAAGITGLLLGGLWNFSFPINKKLWTSSYVLFAAGWSLLLLALFLYLADVRGVKSKTSLSRSFLLVFGTNAITAYVLSELLGPAIALIPVSGGGLLHRFYGILLHAVSSVPFASLLYSLAYVALCWVILYFILYRRRIFLKI